MGKEFEVKNMSKSQLIIAGLLLCLIAAAIPSVLGAEAAGSQVPVQAPTSQISTAPISLQNLPPTTSAVYSNVATKYWLELKAYPSTNVKALWLYVDDDWRYLSSPTSNIENSVQQAFTNPDLFDVQVWYSGNKVIGLVVSTK